MFLFSSSVVIVLMLIMIGGLQGPDAIWCRDAAISYAKIQIKNKGEKEKGENLAVLLRNHSSNRCFIQVSQVQIACVSEVTVRPERATVHSPGQRPGWFDRRKCALKGQKYKNTGDEKTLLPLQGVDTMHQVTQGVALGYGLLPLRGVLTSSFTTK